MSGNRYPANTIAVAIRYTTRDGVDAVAVLRLYVKDHDGHEHKTGENRLSVFTIQHADSQDAYRGEKNSRINKWIGMLGNIDEKNDEGTMVPAQQ